MRTLPNKDCEQCGVTFRWHSGSNGHVGRFCTYDCFVAWQRDHPRPKLPTLPTQPFQQLALIKHTQFDQKRKVYEKQQCFRGHPPWLRTRRQLRCPRCVLQVLQESRRVCKQRRRARQRGAYVVDDVSWRIVAKRDGRNCKGCGAHTTVPGVPLRPDDATMDHVIALSQGGDHSIANAQLLCADCNSLKRDGSMHDLMVRRWARVRSDVCLEEWLLDQIMFEVSSLTPMRPDRRRV